MRAIFTIPIFAILMFSVTFARLADAQVPSSFSLMPVPANLQMGTGQLVVDTSFSVAISGPHDPLLQRALDRFLTDLRRQTGMLPTNMRVSDASKATLVVSAEHRSKDVQVLEEDESYSLEIHASGAKVTAPTSLGAMHGLQTFLQLVRTTSDGFAVPAVNIQDKPRFSWRGLMIDSPRHFIPLDVLKRNLDGMAAVKMNVFHWRLSDNQGFRAESKRFPKLQEMGSDGLYYTQDEIHDLVAYAHDRGIRVIPEFDMPGHSTAWFVGYPELASAPGPYTIERKWGIFDPAMDPTRESTYRFLDELIGEMAKLFPDQFFHIGGDEVNGKQWDGNPKIQEFMHSHDIKDNAGLQAYFTARVQKIVSKHGKTMLGWDEILQPGCPKSVVIQSWRGQESLAQAARLGYRGLLSAGYYIDLIQSAAQHYAVDPMSGDAANLGSEESARILGGEASMWTEYVSPENIDSRIWPRTAAIAERFWSPQSVTDVNSMYQRLDEISRRLEWLGLTHNSSYVPMLRRIAGTDDISALRVLADVVEPVKGYSREETSPVEPTSLMPLNRLIDATRPESATARHFADLVNSLLAGQADASTKEQIRSWLVLWKDNDARLQPLETQSFLLKEVVPLSHNLSASAASGLEAMDYLDRGEHPSDAWKTQQLAQVKQAEEQKGQLLIMVSPSIQKLIDASTGQAVAAPGRHADQEEHLNSRCPPSTSFHGRGGMCPDRCLFPTKKKGISIYTPWPSSYAGLTSGTLSRGLRSQFIRGDSNDNDAEHGHQKVIQNHDPAGQIADHRMYRLGSVGVSRPRFRKGGRPEGPVSVRRTSSQRAQLGVLCRCASRRKLVLGIDWSSFARWRIGDRTNIGG